MSRRNLLDIPAEGLLVCHWECGFTGIHVTEWMKLHDEDIDDKL